MLSQREIDILSYLSQRRMNLSKAQKLQRSCNSQIERFENISKTLNLKLKKMVATLIANKGMVINSKINLMIEFENFLK